LAGEDIIHSRCARHSEPSEESLRPYETPFASTQILQRRKHGKS
jgi:hypothetical protein